MLTAPVVPKPVFLTQFPPGIWWILLAIIILFLIWGLWPRKPRGRGGRRYP